MSNPDGLYENAKAKKLYRKIKKAYGINGLEFRESKDLRDRTVFLFENLPKWLGLIRSDMEKLNNDGYINCELIGTIHFEIPNGKFGLTSNFQLVATLRIEAKGDARLDQKWVHRFYEKHPLLVKLGAPALVLLGAVLGVAVLKLWEYFWPSSPH